MAEGASEAAKLSTVLDSRHYIDETAGLLGWVTLTMTW